jgi:hypothetical protein
MFLPRLPTFVFVAAALATYGCGGGLGARPIASGLPIAEPHASVTLLGSDWTNELATVPEIPFGRRSARDTPPLEAIDSVFPDAAEASSDDLRLELAAVIDARAHVEARNGAAALARLGEIEGSVGVMREERDRLRIEALVITGRADQAADAATAFAEAHPQSPLLVHIRRLVAGAELPSSLRPDHERAR